MTENLTQLGVGGIFAFLIVREVLGFLKRKNGAKTSGDYPPEFWQAEQRKAMAEVIAVTIVPILARQSEIMNEMQRSSTALNQNVAVMLDRLSSRQG